MCLENKRASSLHASLRSVCRRVAALRMSWAALETAWHASDGRTERSRSRSDAAATDDVLSYDDTPKSVIPSFRRKKKKQEGKKRNKGK